MAQWSASSEPHVLVLLLEAHLAPEALPEASGSDQGPDRVVDAESGRNAMALWDAALWDAALWDAALWAGACWRNHSSLSSKPSLAT